MENILFASHACYDRYDQSASTFTPPLVPLRKSPLNMMLSRGKDLALVPSLIDQTAASSSHALSVLSKRLSADSPSLLNRLSLESLDFNLTIQKDATSPPKLVLLIGNAMACIPIYSSTELKDSSLIVRLS